MWTKAELLRYSLAYALRNVRFERRPLKLSEEQRYKLAEDTIAELRRHGNWRELDDVVKTPIGMWS
jgi:hypothetical protein